MNDAPNPFTQWLDQDERTAWSAPVRIPDLPRVDVEPVKLDPAVWGFASEDEMMRAFQIDEEN